MWIKSAKKIYMCGAIFLVLIISNILVSCNEFKKVDSKKEIELTINYVLPDYIYNSKDELFNDFFLDFYNYINTVPGGPYHLTRNGIKSVDDLYKICKEFNKESATGFPLVGDILAPYFLYQKISSNFEEQKDRDFFVGYCLRNDRYVKFLDFLEEYFYHFRMDEGYTGPASLGKNPYGSDFFASSYASIIDTVKFFYYTKDTLPVFFYETNNVPNLYDEIPGLLKTPFDKKITLNYDLTMNDRYELAKEFNCYGFKFIAWYTDPSFNSEQLTYLDNSFIKENSDITLYAKFIDAN